MEKTENTVVVRTQEVIKDETMAQAKIGHEKAVASAESAGIIRTRTKKRWFCKLNISSPIWMGDMNPEFQYYQAKAFIPYFPDENGNYTKLPNGALRRKVPGKNFYEEIREGKKWHCYPTEDGKEKRRRQRNGYMNVYLFPSDGDKEKFTPKFRGFVTGYVEIKRKSESYKDMSDVQLDEELDKTTIPYIRVQECSAIETEQVLKFVSRAECFKQKRAGNIENTAMILETFVIHKNRKIEGVTQVVPEIHDFAAFVKVA